LPGHQSCPQCGRAIAVGATTPPTLLHQGNVLHRNKATE
jgi:hypothetical protein